MAPDIVADRYVLLPESRPGGLSVVRKATDVVTGNFVAVKFVQGKTDDLSRKFFERELSTLRVLDHPNIVELVDFGAGSDDDSFYLVLEWVESSLLDLMRDSGPLTWADYVVDIGAPLASALSHAHLNQIEHRDIKPGNVLMDVNGSPKLADFGIAKVRSNLGDTNLTVADFRSRAYAPPEHDAPMPYVRDVYSMGVLSIQALHEGVIGDFPDVAPALAAIRVSPDVREFLGRCVDPDASARPANGSVFAEELRKLVAEEHGRQLARSNIVELRLTNAARRQISDSDSHVGDVRVEELVLDDLSGDVFVDYRYDAASMTHDRSVLFLTGATRSYTLKLEEAKASFVITAARLMDYELLERSRARALNLGRSCTFSLSQQRDADSARRAVDLLLERLDSHHADRADSRDIREALHEENAIFDEWIQVLKAREDLARGELEPIAYRAVETDRHRVAFTLTESSELDLLGVELEVKHPETRRIQFRGEVISQTNERLVMLAPRGSSRLPREGVLTPYLGPTQVALQRQLDAISAVKAGGCAKPYLRDILVDPSGNAAPIPVPIQNWAADLDESKRRAVSSALGAPDVFLVQGPPGTGKTAFITEAVVQLLRSDANARVLIVSQTHVALDNALERLDHAGVPNLIRLGQAEYPRIATSTRHLLFDNQMAAWARSIRRRAEGHLEREANAAGISADYLRAGLALQEYLDVCLKLERLELALIQEEANPGTELTTSLGVSEDAVNLQSRIDALAIQRQELAEHAGGFLSGDLTISADLTVEDARAALALVVGETGSGDRLLQLLGLQAEWLQRLESDRNLAAAFLETSRVVAGTCLGFLRHPAVRDLEFDICILDEASKATATEALVPLARAKKWILVGDTRQLPPIDEELLRNTELMREYSISEAAISETLFQRLADGLPSHSQELLREQYRMIAPIGDLISTCFYDGELHSPRTDSLRGYESFGRPVLWMDTSGMGDRRREQSPAGSSTSFSNRTEARVVRDRLITLEGALTKGLLAPPDGAGKLDVLVIAPYRAQVEELRLRLAETSFSQLEYTVQSVDAVQGREADLAIFSVTRSNSNGRLGFLGHEYWRRINVALSRAKYGLTIVGDAAFCRSVPGALRTVHEYMTTHPATCEIRVVDHAS